MAKERKRVKLRGKHLVMEARCRNCGHKKRLHYRKNGSERMICGVVEVKVVS